VTEQMRGSVITQHQLFDFTLHALLFCTYVALRSIW